MIELKQIIAEVWGHFKKMNWLLKLVVLITMVISLPIAIGYGIIWGTIKVLLVTPIKIILNKMFK
jgi:hypothetical protein